MTDATLMRIASQARALREARDTLRERLERELDAALAKQETELAMDIIKARNDGYSVSAIARAYTRPGRSPNRVKIYEYLEKYADLVQPTSPESYPFRWEPRTISIGDGTRTVYDLVADFKAFGPDEITGLYRWAVVGGELEPSFVEGYEYMPYPSNIIYRHALEEWMAMNPQPAPKDVF